MSELVANFPCIASFRFCFRCCFRFFFLFWFPQLRQPSDASAHARQYFEVDTHPYTVLVRQHFAICVVFFFLLCFFFMVGVPSSVPADVGAGGQLPHTVLFRFVLFPRPPHPNDASPLNSSVNSTRCCLRVLPWFPFVGRLMLFRFFFQLFLGFFFHVWPFL